MTQNQIGYQYGMGGYHHAGYVSPIDKITADQLQAVYGPLIGWSFPSRTDLEGAVRRRFRDLTDIHRSTDLSYWQFVTRALRDNWVVLGEYDKSLYEKAHIVVGPKTEGPPPDDDPVVRHWSGTKDGITTTIETFKSGRKREERTDAAGRVISTTHYPPGWKLDDDLRDDATRLVTPAGNPLTPADVLKTDNETEPEDDGRNLYDAMWCGL